MPKVTMPDGTEVDMPDQISPEMGQRLRSYIQAQHGKTEETKPVQFATGNLDKGIAQAVGAPVDIAQDVLNLGKAAVGTVAGMAGRPDLMPEVKTDAVGSSKWIESLMRQHRMITEASTPKSLPGKIAASALQAGGNLLGGAAATEGAIKAASKVESLIKKPPAEGIIQGETQNTKTIRESRKAGYVFPPTQANPTVANRILEGAGGKRQTAQEASIRNQEVSNNLAKGDLGVSKNTPLSPETIQLVRDEAGLTYDKVRAFDQPIKPTGKYLRDMASLNGEFASLEKTFPGLTKNPEVDELKKLLTNENFLQNGMSAGDAIDLTRLLRHNATVNFKAANLNGGNPEKLALAQAQRDAASHVEDLLSTALKSAGKEKLYREWVDARKTFAISHDIESALNPATGNISEAAVAGLARKGRPLTGGLEKIANYARAFPRGAQPPERVAGVPDSIMDLFLASLGGGIGGSHAGVGGGVAGTMAGLAARPATRNLILSDLYQNRFVAK